MKRTHSDSDDDNDEEDIPSQTVDIKPITTKSRPLKKQKTSNTEKMPENDKIEVGSPQNNAPSPSSSGPGKKKFLYGNYTEYYQRRKTFKGKDWRLRVFKLDWFKNNTCLDIGCNTGDVAIYIAKHFECTKIIGVDIDGELIAQACNSINEENKLSAPPLSKFPPSFTKLYGNIKSSNFPNNIEFREEDYLQSKTEENIYDVILCLSVTKWIHLHYGDEGIYKLFKKIYDSLKEGGRFILEAQVWSSYKRRSSLTPEMKQIYKKIKVRPENFPQYLMEKIGFKSFQEINMPDEVKANTSHNLQRPLYCLFK